jgi:primosomal protein N' (replication factor Y)
MNTEIFARIVFTSSLPALDREFEYRVASDLKESVRVGQRVSVNFSGQEKEGFIVSLSDQQEFKGTLSEVNKLISEVPVLNPDIYSLIKTLAARQCASVGELVANAVPHRSVRVERGFTFAATVSLEFQPGVVESELVTPVAESDTGKPRFISRIVEISKGYLEAGRSVIITVPDFRDVNRIESELVAVLGRDSVIRNDSTQVASERYRNFLAQLVSEAKVVIGTRTTMYLSLIHI